MTIGELPQAEGAGGEEAPRNVHPLGPSLCGTQGKGQGGSQAGGGIPWLVPSSVSHQRQGQEVVAGGEA